MVLWAAFDPVLLRVTKNTFCLQIAAPNSTQVRCPRNSVMRSSTLESATPDVTSVDFLGHHVTDDLRDDLAHPPHMQPPHFQLALANASMKYPARSTE